MASPLVNAIEFMKSFGIFDVVLPFLLVFTVIFGVLEKTKIFGEENGKTRKNINSMVAFSVAFFVIAATQVVNIMQAALPMIMLLLVLVIAFMIVYGSTLSEGNMNIWEDMDKDDDSSWHWKNNAQISYSSELGKGDNDIPF